MNKQIANFFIEALNRVRTKSPKFFYILQIIGGALTMAGKIPVMIHKYTDIMMSPGFVEFCNDLGNTALGVMLGAFFSAETKPTAITESGDVLKKLDENKYPFTAKVEQQKAEKADTPIVHDPLPKE